MGKRCIFVSLLILPTIASCTSSPKEIIKRSFVFRSDYCSLNNEASYENNREVNLTLKIKDEYKDVYELPNDIKILVGDKAGTKGVDYQYQINDDKTASLSLTISQNIVVDIMYQNSDNVYRVNESQFNKALKMENVNYVQRYYTFTDFSKAFISSASVTDFVSPTVNYYRSISSTDSDTGASLSKTVFLQNYHEKKNDGVYAYNYTSSSGAWTKLKVSDKDFITPSSISPLQLAIFIGQIKYQDVKDHYDKSRLSYYYKKTISGVEYDITLSFYENLLFVFNFETEASAGSVGTMNFSYAPVTPDLPPVTSLAQNH